MNRLFESCLAVREARNSLRYKGIFSVVIAFLLVSFGGGLVASILTAIPQTAYIVNSADFREAAAAGNENAVYEAIERLLASPPAWMGIVSLFATAGSIAAVLLYCRRSEHRRLYTLGICREGAVCEYLLGFLFGAAAITASAAAIIATGNGVWKGAESGANAVYIILYFAGYLVQGFSEELLLRGFLLVSLSKNCSGNTAVLGSAAVFALFHLGNNAVTPLALINLFLFGVFAAICFLKRGSIWMIAAFHSAWNFVQGNILGISVSGGAGSESVFGIGLTGADWLSGGGFGAEGSIFTTAVLAISVLLACISKQKRLLPPRFCERGEFCTAAVSESDFSADAR